MGHNLGMWHDFKAPIPYDCEKPRKFEGEICKGLMDYIDDGVAWSKCSMMDFSRYLAPKIPCLKREN